MLSRHDSSAALTTWWNVKVWLPFYESEDGGNFIGPGHQDPSAFCSYVNYYSETLLGQDPDEVPRALVDDVKHEWALVEDERLNLVDDTTPGAIPVTTIWGLW